MIQEIAITLNTRKNFATTILIFAVFACLFVYLLQIGILSQTSQQIKKMDSERITFQKDRFTFASQPTEGLSMIENKIAGLDFIKTDKIKYIPVADAYLVSSGNLVKATR